jgi:hypothetical protein
VDIEPPADPDAQVALALPKADETATTKASDDRDTDDGTPWLPIALGAVLVAMVAGAAAYRSRSGARR